MKARGRILIVASRFNQKITDSLLAAAEKTLYHAGIPEDRVGVVRVPGAFELPVMAAKAAESSDWDAVICLGCIIRGGTPHFDYVCNETARGLMDTSLRYGKPIIFGILTTHTSRQAMERSGLASPTGADPEGIKQCVANKGLTRLRQPWR